MPDFDRFTFESDFYREMEPRWRFTDEVKTGRYADADTIETYLRRRGQAESDGMYTDRRAMAENDPNMALQELFGSIVGQMFGTDSRLSITWGETLGDPDDPASRANQLLTNVDGAGKNLAVFLREIVDALLTYDHHLILVEGPARPGREQPTTWKIITPDKVPDTLERRGRLVEVKVAHRETDRESLDEEPTAYDVRTFYRLGGFDRYRRKATSGAKEPWQDVTPEEAAYEFFERTTNEPRLPLVRADLPLSVYVGYYLARMVVAIFNQQSEKNNVLRIACTPKLVVTTDADMKANDAEARIQAGGNFMKLNQGDGASYIAPPTGPASVRMEAIEQMTRRLKETAHQRYADAARQKTATEINQDERGGRESLLVMVAAALDEALGECLFLSEQVEAPGRPAAWGLASVEREGAFRMGEAEAKTQKEKERFFGEAVVPKTEAAEIAAIERQYAAAQIDVDEEHAEAIAEMVRTEHALTLLERAADVAERLDSLGADGRSALSSAGLPDSVTGLLTRRDTVPTNGEMR